MSARPPRRPGPLLALAAAPLALALFGCASTTSLTNMWVEPGYSQGTMQNVLVVALRKDPARRRLWEDGFVNELSRHGMTATPSYRLFQDAPPDTARAIEAVRAHGYDGVVVTSMLPTGVQTREVPGYVTTEPVTYLSPWTGMYYTAYREVYQPGYTETDQVYRFRTDVWTTKEGGRLVWTGTISTLESPSRDLIKDTTARKIVPELVEHGIVPPKAG